MAWHNIDPRTLKHKIYLTKWQRYALIALLLVMVGLSAGLVAAIISPPPLARPPKEVAEKLVFPLYMPAKLPAGFSVIPHSFKEMEGTLLYTATHANGRKLAVSQQAKPKDFNFAEFYKEQMPGVKALPGSPHETVYGQAPDSWVVSILTNDTWIIVSSRQPISESDAKTIAYHLIRI